MPWAWRWRWRCTWSCCAGAARGGWPHWPRPPCCWTAYQLQIEQTVMPDSWFEALIVTGLVLLLWQPEPPWPLIAAGGLALGSSATVRQVGEILVLPAACYAVIAARGWAAPGGPRRGDVRRVRAADHRVQQPVPGADRAFLAFPLRSHHDLYGRAAAAADCADAAAAGQRAEPVPDAQQQASGSDQLEHSPALAAAAVLRQPAVGRGVAAGGRVQPAGVPAAAAAGGGGGRPGRGEAVRADPEHQPG